jgi:hypothetical protein
MFYETTIHDSCRYPETPRPVPAGSTRGLIATLVAAAALALAFPTFATADSVAFVRGGDVHLATGDFTRDYRVTYTGGYSDVSQADDGTMIALKGVRLHRLDRSGRVLADFDTPVSDTRPAPAKTFHGPFDPAISPDGTKVAYTYYYLTQSQNSSCFPPACVTTINEGGTGYSHADRQTAWDEPGLGRHSGWRHPTWIDNDDVLISDPTHAWNYDVLTDTVGDSGVPIKEWFTDNGTAGLHGGELTRQGTKVAFVGGQGGEELRVYATSGPPPALPTPCYTYSGPSGGRYGMPSWSPDGTRLVFADADGVKLVSVPDFAGGCTTAGASPTAVTVIAGGSEPDWGPADVPPSRPDPTVPSGGAAPSGSPRVDTAAPGRTARIRVTGIRLRAALRRGITVRVSGARPGRLRLDARAGTRRVASGAATAGADGTAAVRLQFTPAARRLLASKRIVKLTIGAPGLRAAAVTLKR